MRTKLNQVNPIKLDDCFTKDNDLALMNGVQALVRLLIEQAKLDKKNGLATNGYVSGYPGSPLGTLDLELGRARKHLDLHNIVFQPAVNEELAATAAWGTQMLGLYDKPDIDGVFSMWYGKGPGLDRAMDALRHANMGGVSSKGGMILAVAEDPIGKSSTLAYQSEQSLISAGIPVFYPANVNEVISMGLQAYALSRHAGICVGLKITGDTADSNAVIDMGLIRPKLLKPDNPINVHVNRHDPALEREEALINRRIPASKDFIAKNNINEVIYNPNDKEIGIIAVGKAATETIDAFDTIGIKSPHKKGVGLFACKVPWPLINQEIIEFCKDYKEIIVIEEKAGIVEEQIAHILFNDKKRPLLSGKNDAISNKPLIPKTSELSSDIIADCLLKKLPPQLTESVVPDVKSVSLGDNLPPVSSRTPWYCAGCPHNSGTKTPDEEIVGIGIGCHSIGYFLHPEKLTNFSQMGGEGGHWIGRAPFSNHNHIFQNIGDGTYAHSGSLAIRAAVSANVNVTFKILYNDAVAMTGGQQAIGGATPWNISKQLSAEGVKKIYVVSDEPEQFQETRLFADGVSMYHRDDLIKVQKEVREIKGVTAIIYVQTCATELRRRRKRGLVADREVKMFINPDVCEGCGDCAEKSNCVAVKPLDHFDGTKKQIDQSVCNKDYSCSKGFCPSFIGVTSSKSLETVKKIFPPLPLDINNLESPKEKIKDIKNIIMAGIGGTGVSTIAAIIVMAARLDKLYAQSMNFTGLAQKNGAVTSQIRISSNKSLYTKSARLPNETANLLLGCDAVVSVSPSITRTLNTKKTKAIVNGRVEPLGVAGVHIGKVVDDQLLKKHLEIHINSNNINFVDISSLAEALVGDTVSANIMMLGLAAQNGFLPIDISSIEKAIELNGVAINQNITAFRWGRLLAENPKQVFQAAGLFEKKEKKETVQDYIDNFSKILELYQDKVYANKFNDLVNKLFEKENKLFKDKIELPLTRKVALTLFRLMRYKDEYEVARLHTTGDFANQFLSNNKEAKLEYYLAPPLFSKIDKDTGHLQKRRFGSWMFNVFKILSNFKFLRGTKFDLFGYTAERKSERVLAQKIMNTIIAITENLDQNNHKRVLDFLEIPLSIKGYGHIKEKNMKIAETKWDTSLEKIIKSKDLKKSA